MQVGGTFHCLEASPKVATEICIQTELRWVRSWVVMLRLEVCPVGLAKSLSLVCDFTFFFLVNFSRAALAFSMKGRTLFLNPSDLTEQALRIA